MHLPRAHWLRSISHYFKFSDNDCISKLFERAEYALYEVPEGNGVSTQSPEPTPPPSSSVAVAQAPEECIICFEAKAIMVRHSCQPSSMCEACCERFQESKGFDTATFYMCPLCGERTTESEWSQVTPEGVVEAPAAAPTYAVVLLRRKYYVSPSLFGVPFLLPLAPAGITGSAVHRAVEAYLAAADVQPEGDVYELLVCNDFGTSCRRCNLPDCAGCVPIADTGDIVAIPPGARGCAACFAQLLCCRIIYLKCTWLGEKSFLRSNSLL